ncbi:gamma-glutamylcyclotransferase family protein [Actinoplanes utahensis]|uniref:gamma-glutamylcyclotransferase family protein n=1 Tax=Actinoplanes utahensis TaxID=1869 RepID=UPI00068EC322|nr:gamma-glutamylcyclotransferase family protein [Actinoplanes utahensis]GIF27342.1 hypothetical protein Aut01nite_03280 [Actinoplanes utahensis]
MTDEVRPGQPAADFAVDPYPGRRPAGSWVVDRHERCWPVRPDEGRPSGWAVVLSAIERMCLDDWLAGQGATRIAERVPLLSYGSNACPGKILRNGTSLPAVNLACEIADLASVWCTGTTRAGRLPATLAAVPGHVETAVLTLADPGELDRLDMIEGRSTGWYTLQLLHTGRVTLENGARVLRPAAYIGGRPERRPALLHGRPVPLTSVDYAAVAPLRTLFTAGAPEPIGDEVPDGTYPHPGECTPAVFAYGTLMPGRSRAHLLAPRLAAEPWAATAYGDLRDTGFGHPALNAAADRKAPGVLCMLRPETIGATLAVLDQVEGAATGLYSRQLRTIDGTLSWVYMADGCAGTGVPIDAWR